MEQFITLVIAIIIAFLVYKRLSKRMKEKGKGRVSTVIVSSALSFLTFIIIIVIAATNESPSTKKIIADTDNNHTDMIDVAGVPTFKWTEDPTEIGGYKKLHELINNDLKSNPELTKNILKEISSYHDDDSMRGASQTTYIQYGVSLKDSINALKNSDCLKEKNSSENRINYWYKSNITPVTDYPNDMDRKRIEYQNDLVTYKVAQAEIDTEKAFEICSQDIYSKMKNKLQRENHVIQSVNAKMSQNLECAQKHNGDYMQCYD